MSFLIKNGTAFSRILKSINIPKSNNKNFFNNIDEEVQDKFDEYTKYIDTHIENIYISWKVHKFDILSWCSTRIEMNTKFVESTLIKNIKDHDISKYDPEEFLGYRVKFYPTEMEKKLIELDDRSYNIVENSFNTAWIKHAHTNKHHPEYWFTKDYDEKRNEWYDMVVPMDILYIIEMLLDWDAMGIKFGGNAYTYWQEHKQEKILHSTTITLIEDLIPVFKYRNI